jgi:hypothetical protein
MLSVWDGFMERVQGRGGIWRGLRGPVAGDSWTSAKQLPPQVVMISGSPAIRVFYFRGRIEP